MTWYLAGVLTVVVALFLLASMGVPERGVRA